MLECVLFLDDGGVLSDNRSRAAQWQRLVGEYMAQRLGGTPEAWAEANRVLIAQFFEPAAWQTRLAVTPDYAAFDRQYQLDWMHTMCDLLDRPRLPDADALALADAATAYITPRVHAAFPGAPEAVRALHTAGYVLYTASGESSRDLTGYLTAMGVRDCFRRLYGPDLVGIMKSGPEYYARIFADAGVDPAAALVVDDSALALGYAAAVGARTLHITATPADSSTVYQLSCLADLPALLPILHNTT